jgi:hypothetical protein
VCERGEGPIGVQVDGPGHHGVQGGVANARVGRRKRGPLSVKLSVWVTPEMMLRVREAAGRGRVGELVRGWVGEGLKQLESGEVSK